MTDKYTFVRLRHSNMWREWKFFLMPLTLLVVLGIRVCNLLSGIRLQQPDWSHWHGQTPRPVSPWTRYFPCTHANISRHPGFEHTDLVKCTTLVNLGCSIFDTPLVYYLQTDWTVHLTRSEYTNRPNIVSNFAQHYYIVSPELFSNRLSTLRKAWPNLQLYRLLNDKTREKSIWLHIYLAFGLGWSY